MHNTRSSTPNRNVSFSAPSTPLRLIGIKATPDKPFKPRLEVINEMDESATNAKRRKTQTIGTGQTQTIGTGRAKINNSIEEEEEMENKVIAVVEEVAIVHHNLRMQNAMSIAISNNTIFSNDPYGHNFRNTKEGWNYVVHGRGVRGKTDTKYQRRCRECTHKTQLYCVQCSKWLEPEVIMCCIQQKCMNAHVRRLPYAEMHPDCLCNDK